jgi:hypothetical protein
MWDLVCTTVGCPQEGNNQPVPEDREWYTCDTCGAIYNRVEND